MARAYILVNAQAGSAPSIQRALEGHPGVRTADLVIGSHDLVLVVEGADIQEIAKFVLNEVHGTPGVSNTLTYPVVEASHER